MITLSVIGLLSLVAMYLGSCIPNPGLYVLGSIGTVLSLTLGTYASYLAGYAYSIPVGFVLLMALLFAGKGSKEEFKFSNVDL